MEAAARAEGNTLKIQDLLTAGGGTADNYGKPSNDFMSGSMTVRMEDLQLAGSGGADQSSSHATSQV